MFMCPACMQDPQKAEKGGRGKKEAEESGRGREGTEECKREHQILLESWAALSIMCAEN